MSEKLSWGTVNNRHPTNLVVRQRLTGSKVVPGPIVSKKIIFKVASDDEDDLYSPYAVTRAIPIQ